MYAWNAPRLGARVSSTEPIDEARPLPCIARASPLIVAADLRVSVIAARLSSSTATQRSTSVTHLRDDHSNNSSVAA